MKGCGAVPPVSPRRQSGGGSFPVLPSSQPSHGWHSMAGNRCTSVSFLPGSVCALIWLSTCQTLCPAIPAACGQSDEVCTPPGPLSGYRSYQVWPGFPRIFLPVKDLLDKMGDWWMRYRCLLSSPTLVGLPCLILVYFHEDL